MSARLPEMHLSGASKDATFRCYISLPYTSIDNYQEMVKKIVY